MKAAKFDYDAPATLDKALERLRDGKPMSGGQSLGPMLNMRLTAPELLVDIRSLPELRGFKEADGKLSIGAAITHAEIEDGVLPDTTRGMLPAIAADIAYRPVRTRGTIGGSLCHADPAADWPAAMLALGADLVLAKAGATRRLAIDEFLTGAFATALEDGEILAAIELPVLSESARWGYYKFCRKTGEFAETICAIVHDPIRDIARVVLGALGGAPRRLTPLEENRKAGEDEIAAAIDALGITLTPAQRAMHITAVTRAFAQVSGA